MTTVTVDPRVRARRIAVRKEQGHRRLRRLVLIVGAVALVFGALVVSRSSLLDVDRIEIYGLDRVSLRETEEALGFQLGSPLVTLDTGAAETALESIAWIDDAMVRRSWRGTVVVEVTERRPVAIALTQPDRWVLVDPHGRVLSEPLANPPDLPRLSGLRAAPEIGGFMDADSGAALAVVQALPPSLHERVYGVWRDSRGELQIGVDEGATILFGDDDRLRAKVVAAATMLDHLALEGVEPVHLDVSVPNLPVVRTQP